MSSLGAQFTLLLFMIQIFRWFIIVHSKRSNLKWIYRLIVAIAQTSGLPECEFGEVSQGRRAEMRHLVV